MSRMSWRAVPGPEGPALLAHWLSDAVTGILLGISCAVVTALMIGQIQRRVEGRQGAA
jgi:tetrahydromethanopterin S-methyltransferase subunit B